MNQQSKITKQIKRIIANNNGSQRSIEYQHKVISYIFKLYESNCSDVDDVAINYILRACILFNATHKALEHRPFWSDVEKRMNAQNNAIEYALLIKMCIKSNNFCKGKQIISALKLCTFEHRAMKTVLIDFYGHFGDLMAAKTCFDSIAQKDSVCIGSMMKVFIKSQCVEYALSLYEEYNCLTNEVCDLLAIKSCMKAKKVQKAKEIHSRIREQNKFQSVSLKTTLIDFYGTIGELESAQSIFDSIRSDERHLVHWCDDGSVFQQQTTRRMLGIV